MPEGLQVIKVSLPEDIEEIEIIPIGDTHTGDSMYDESHLKDVIAYVLDSPNRYVILNGDLINNAIKTAISDTYGFNHPEHEIAHVARLFMQIKDRILAIGTGNHEERTARLTGIDPSRYISVRLGLEDRYADNSFLLFVSVGKSYSSRSGNTKQQVYSFFVQHGFGGGKKNGSKLNNLNDADKIVADADVYIMGHTHTPIANVMSVFLTDVQNRSVYRKNKYYLMHNAYLDFGGYGLRKGFAPAAKEITYLTLKTQGRKRIKLSIGI